MVVTGWSTMIAVLSTTGVTDMNELIALFDSYREYIGDEEETKWQLEFKDKFNAWICRNRGHEIGPDHCLKPEHDLCYRCNRLVSDLKQEPGYKVYKTGGEVL
jgi:hypothetical protein